MPNQIILTVIEGNLTGQQFTFQERTTCLVGRARDANIKLPDDEAHRTISRYHCLLDINPPDVRVRDFGSLNGTYVNDKKIGQRESHQTPEAAAKIKFPEYDLQTGDKIKLSDTVFQITIECARRGYSPTLKVENQSLLVNPDILIQKANAGEQNLLAIRNYTILHQLGKGGFGAVYLARHDTCYRTGYRQRTGEEVALKVMLPHVVAYEGAIERFMREMENTKVLRHQNIVKLKDNGYWNNTFFFTLEYCNGGSVIDLMRQRRGPLPIDEAVNIILQVLDGLEYAHNAEIPNVKLAQGGFGRGWGLVHRDIKPANIFLVEYLGNRIAKIGDYGLAKAFDLAGLSGQTLTGEAAGTPFFMPRQQVIDFKYAKPEVDIWATAASLYYMLTGNFPRDFIGKDPLLAVLQTDPVPIRQRDDRIPSKLAEVIDRALIDNPEIHFKNASDFRRSLLQTIAT
jgi:serine/threonine protein kinase